MYPGGYGCQAWCLCWPSKNPLFVVVQTYAFGDLSTGSCFAGSDTWMLWLLTRCHELIHPYIQAADENSILPFLGNSVTSDVCVVFRFLSFYSSPEGWKFLRAYIPSSHQERVDICPLYHTLSSTKAFRQYRYLFCFLPQPDLKAGPLSISVLLLPTILQRSWKQSVPIPEPARSRQHWKAAL